MKIDDLSAGQSAEIAKTITSEDIMSFAAATGDFNPVHIDDEAGKQSPFGERIAHGMLSAGLISAVLGMKLPGPGAIYMSQSLRFVRPVKIGDTITARAEVTEVITAKKRAKLATTCHNQNSELVLEGEALVMVPDG